MGKVTKNEDVYKGHSKYLYLLAGKRPLSETET